MPHYADGEQACVGDVVKGKPYNTDYPITGVVIKLVEAESCNLQVAFTVPGRIKRSDIDAPEMRTTVWILGQPIEVKADYGATKDFVRLGSEHRQRNGPVYFNPKGGVFIPAGETVSREMPPAYKGHRFEGYYLCKDCRKPVGETKPGERCEGATSEPSVIPTGGKGNDPEWRSWAQQHSPREYQEAELLSQLATEQTMHAAWRKRAEEAEAFKAYVHKRLDDAGVPIDPDSPHKAEGCRIGGRLDWVLGSKGFAAGMSHAEEVAASVPVAVPEAVDRIGEGYRLLHLKTEIVSAISQARGRCANG